MFCGSLIHWHWKASIISHLSVVIPSIPFKNGAELLQSPYQITLVRDTALHAVFESANSGHLKKLWNTKFADKEKSLKTTEEEVLAMVKGDNYAWFEAAAFVRSLPEYKDCSITDTGYVLVSFDNAFLIAKDSPFEDIFNHAITKIQESGELDRIKAKYWIKEPDCGGAKGRSLGFDSLGFAFLVFAIGPLLSGILLIGEIMKNALNLNVSLLDKKVIIVAPLAHNGACKMPGPIVE